jgi:hypothetical protein
VPRRGPSIFWTHACALNSNTDSIPFLDQYPSGVDLPALTGLNPCRNEPVIPIEGPSSVRTPSGPQIVLALLGANSTGFAEKIRRIQTLFGQTGGCTEPS